MPTFFFGARRPGKEERKVSGEERHGTAWLEKLRTLAESAAAANGLGLFDLETRLSGRRWWIRVTLDREDGPVTLADCESVSRHLSVLVDVEDVVPHAFDLEVSSPGVERPLRSLRDFARFRGQRARVVLGAGGPLAGMALEGEISGVEGDEVVMTVGEEAARFPADQIKKAHLLFDFASELKEKKRHVQ
jgi:ribosome maturation factor RimP